MLWGHCWEGGGTPAYWPWAQIVGSLLHAPDARERLARMGPAGAYVAQLVAESRADLSLDATPPPPSQALAPEDARFYLFSSVARFLAGVAERAPLLLLLDDLHADDGPSLLLLRFLARELRSARIVAVGTARTADARQRPETARLLGALARDARTIPLAGLSPEDVGRLMAQTVGTSPSHRLVSAVHRVTEGNPLFVDELTRWLGAEGRLDAGALARGELHIPAGIRQAIHGRILPLAEETQTVLSVAAAIGREFNLVLLGRAANLEPDVALERVGEAVVAGVVSEVPGRLGTYAFAHPLFRETLYAETPPHQRAGAHRRIGEALESLHAGDLDDHLEALAFHFCQASVDGEGDRAAAYALRAGEHALALFAYEEAAVHFERGLQALELTADSAEERRCELLLALGEAQQRAGRIEPAKETVERAAAIARRLRALELLARAALAYGGFAIDEYATEPTPAILLEEALATLDERDSALRARVLARLSRQQVLSGSWPRRVALGREAVAMARRAGDKAALAYALDGLVLASWAEGPTTERIAAADEITRLAQDTDDSELALHASLWRIGLLVELGDLAAADREIEAHVQSATRLGHPELLWVATGIQAMRALIAGRFSESERHLASGLEIARRWKIRSAPRIYSMQLLTLTRERGSLADIEPALRAAAERYPAMAVYRAVLVFVCIEQGHLTEARAELERLAADEFAHVPRDSSWPVSLAYLSEACARLADPEHAAALYALLSPRAGTNLGVIVAWLGPAAYYLGILAATMGRLEEAEGHFESALASSRAMQAEPFEARIEAAYGRLLEARDAPGDRDAARDRSCRALAIARRLGMQRLVEALEPAPASPDAPGAAPETPGEPAAGIFVGREREMAELEAALQRAAAGDGGLVLISGEPGVGKTRLLTEVARGAERSGTRVLRGSACEGLSAPPYRPWTQVLRACLADGPSGPDPPRAPRDPTLASELRDLLPAAPTPVLLDSAESRFRLFDAVATALRDRAAREPVLILLDDLQWADESSLLLLGFLARELRGARLLILAAYRDVEARLAAEGGQRIAELACDARTLRGGGLHEADVAVFIERATGDRPAADLVRAILRATEGNPLFVDEVLRTLIAQGGRLDAPAPVRLPLPDRVRAVIGRRTALVSEPTRRVLAVASVIGKDIDLATLEAVCASTGDHPLEAIDEATRARILVHAEGQPAFAHDLFRETVYDDLPPRERCRLHGLVGAALERLHGEPRELWLPELAHHFCLAGPARAAEAVRYSVRAAERATLGFAHAEAVGHYRKALQSLSASGAADVAERCRILLALGESLWSTGEAEEARRVYEEAAERAGALGLGPELARAALGFGGHDVSYDGGVVEPRLIRLLEQGLARIGEADGVLRASLMARLAAALAFSPERDRGAALAHDAVAMARRLGDKPTLHLALSCFIGATWGPDNLEERLALSRETARLAIEIGGAGVAELHAAIVTFLFEAGDAAGAEREAESYRRRTEIAGRRISRWIVAVRNAMSALLEGRLADAEGLATQALHLGSEGGIPNAAQYYGAQMLALRREQGRLDEMVAPIEHLVAAYPAVPAWRAALAWVYAELGRDADARRELNRLAARDFTDLPRDMFWLLCLWLLAEVVTRLGDDRRAATLYELLRPFGARCVTAGAAFCSGSVERSLGLLAGTLSRMPDAARHLEAAIAANERLGSRPWVAYAEHDYARALLAAGAPGNHERALVLLARAERTARELGMTALAERTQRLRATAPPGAHPPERERAAAEAGDSGLFRREGEYWTIAYAGTVVRMKDAKGLRYIVELLRHPDTELHAQDLIASITRPAVGATVRATGGDSGPILDAAARDAYRQRLEDLRDELAEAEAHNDTGRAEKARGEIDFLARTLASAVGLGGRERRAGSSSERARLVVTKAIKASLQRIGRDHPALGRILTSSIRTGTFCSYRPDPRAPIAWDL